MTSLHRPNSAQNEGPLITAREPQFNSLHLHSYSEKIKQQSKQTLFILNSLHNASRSFSASECQGKKRQLLIPTVKAKSFNSCHTYEFQAGDSDIERVFAKMEAEKSKSGIVDWGMSETTLEEVLIKIVDLAGADNV